MHEPRGRLPRYSLLVRWAGQVIGSLSLLIVASCGGDSGPSPAAEAASDPTSPTTTSVAPASPSVPSPSETGVTTDTATGRPTEYDLSTFEGEWQLICEPYLPRDGASAGGFVYDQSGPDVLTVTQVGFRWRNPSCAGDPTEREIYDSFEQRVVGIGEVEGQQVLRVEDSRGFLDVIVVDADDRLRFGDINGPLDDDGFPASFEAIEKAAIRR